MFFQYNVVSMNSVWFSNLDGLHMGDAQLL